MMIKGLEREGAANDLTYRRTREIDAQVARLRWLLSAYPSALGNARQ